MTSIRQQLEALKLPDDRTGLKQNAVIDKVLDIIGTNVLRLPAAIGATVYIPYAFRDLDESICSGYDAVRFVGYRTAGSNGVPDFYKVYYSESNYTEDVLPKEMCLTEEDAKCRLCKLISELTGEKIIDAGNWGYERELI